MHGRYPEHDVLAQSRHWDEPTREVVMARLQPPAYRHFQAAEVRTLEAFCDTITEQDGDPRIEVLRYIDKDLFEGSGPGHRYADMPPDGEAWRIVAAALDHTAVELGDCSFSDLDADARSRVVAGFAGGEIKGAGWDDLPLGHAWSVITNAVVTAFYAHPWAWNEIGFGGPGYPRGYMRLGADQREPWEGEEARELVDDFQRDVEHEPGMQP